MCQQVAQSLEITSNLWCQGTTGSGLRLSSCRWQFGSRSGHKRTPILKQAISILAEVCAPPSQNQGLQPILTRPVIFIILVKALRQLVNRRKQGGT
jgi:hypothetical protein